MGPRSEERGNSDPRPRGKEVRSASMGPRSEERGNMASWPRRNQETQPLQWGRAPKNAEISPNTDETATTVRASMGPRSEERGNNGHDRTRFATAACFNGAALRRTRKSESVRVATLPGNSFNGAALRRTRKSRPHTHHPAIFASLQWGRAPKNAEITDHCALWFVAGSLQWGRAPKNAEIDPGIT